jgi:hypothetical protein
MHYKSVLQLKAYMEFHPRLHKYYKILLQFIQWISIKSLCKYVLRVTARDDVS